MFTDRLTFAETVAIVVSSPPNSAVRFALDKGWSREAHLMANLGEQMGGALDMEGRYARPGVPHSQTQKKPKGPFPAESMTMDEMDAKLAQRYQSGAGQQDVKSTPSMVL